MRAEDLEIHICCTEYYAELMALQEHMRSNLDDWHGWFVGASRSTDYVLMADTGGWLRRASGGTLERREGLCNILFVRIAGFGRLDGHIVLAGTCNGGTKTEPVQLSAPQSGPSAPTLPKSVAQTESDLTFKYLPTKGDIISGQNSSPDVCGHENSSTRETKPFIQPPLPPDAPRSSVPSEPTLKSFERVFQGLSTESTHSPSTKGNSANLERMMPQTNEGRAAAESPCLFSPPSAPSLSGPTAFPAAADYPRLSNLSVNRDVPCKTALSQSGTRAPVPDNLPSKWKCTLCDIEFLDKSAIVNHVKSQEHEARIQVVKRSVGEKPLPTLPQRQSTSPGSLPKEELVEIVRQVVAEELPALLRSELRKIFNAALKEPLKESASNGSAASRSPLDMDPDTQCISTHGNSLRCTLCDCPITSSANLAIHLDGKKHKANCAKLRNGRGVP
ncbi:hypothetical protein TSMEX_001639 [Taenia solium]|eukprot:TsM_000921100 transcript=TsM_000921100 gene=TsM_000921100